MDNHLFSLPLLKQAPVAVAVAQAQALTLVWAQP